MKRTIREARRALEEDFAPTMNDFNMQRARQVLEAAEREAVKYTDGYLDTVVPEIEEAVVEATRELTEVRDDLDSLRSSASDGRISASEYASQETQAEASRGYRRAHP